MTISTRVIGYMDRSATPVILGFLFQANAAIVLMLENIKGLKLIRLENNEDIDIELNDGTYVLAPHESSVLLVNNMKI